MMIIIKCLMTMLRFYFYEINEQKRESGLSFVFCCFVVLLNVCVINEQERESDSLSSSIVVLCYLIYTFIIVLFFVFRCLLNMLMAVAGEHTGFLFVCTISYVKTKIPT
jgi:hypothetical protein